jgi:hypothetical protein
VDGLKKLKQQNHKCVGLRGGTYEVDFFSLVTCFLYKAKDLAAPLILGFIFTAYLILID